MAADATEAAGATEAADATEREVAGLSAEDGWALVYAARLLAAPDPDFWRRKLP